jgi:hypothetical protein
VNAKLPANATATDVIDFVSDAVADLIISTNGRDLTRAEFDAAFNRTFPIALSKFMDGVAAERPELAERIRTEFLAEQSARQD